MAEKIKTHTGKIKHTEHGLGDAGREEAEKKPSGGGSGTTSILALLLLLSVLANVFFIVQIMDLNNQIANLKKGGTPTCPGGSCVVATGPQTTVTTAPTSGLIVAAGKIVKVDYVGKFQNGTLFDTSIEDEADKAGMRNPLRAYKPLVLVPGKGQVIEGFEKGIMGMRVGETKTITIPPEDGYAEGQLAGKTLIFDVTIKDVKEPEKLNAIVVNDKRCENCKVAPLMEQLTGIFPGLEYREVDYGSEEGRKLYAESKLKFLPAVLFEEAVKDAEGYDNVKQFVDPAGKYLSLRVGSTFDPAAEICGNNIDDNGDGLIDCLDPACKKEPACMEKMDKPTVELFVMSHCPYGTQMEKGMLPVVELLKGKIDYTVKFCSYAMHGAQEVEEEVKQYCIQKEFSDKYIPYLKCFLGDGKSAQCVKNTGIDEAKLLSCYNKTDDQYKITQSFNNQSTWLSGRYPVFDIYKADNEKYGIQGSPGLVINGVVTNSARDPQSLLNAICAGFKELPAECATKLSTTTPSAGFGFGEAAAGTTSGGGCGV